MVRPRVWLGACAVDVATGQMLVGQWTDDDMRSQVGLPKPRQLQLAAKQFHANKNLDVTRNRRSCLLLLWLLATELHAGRVCFPFPCWLPLACNGNRARLPLLPLVSLPACSCAAC